MYLDCIHVKARDNHVIINKAVYSAINEAEGLRELQNFAKKWDEKYPVIFDIWQRIGLA